MDDVQKKNQPILIEGANALMLDLDFGTYPYVTSVSLKSSESPLPGTITGQVLRRKTKNPTKSSTDMGISGFRDVHIYVYRNILILCSV